MGAQIMFKVFSLVASVCVAQDSYGVDQTCGADHDCKSDSLPKCTTQNNDGSGVCVQCLGPGDCKENDMYSDKNLLSIFAWSVQERATVKRIQYSLLQIH